MIRETIVAGQFYPSKASDLDSFFSSVLKMDQTPREAKAIVVPHAGYIYSGKIAAEAFAQVSVPDNIVLLGPNHTGRGTPISIFEKGAWMTPYGEIPINEEFTSHLLTASSKGKADISAHIYEHSLEVQLPFLQYVKKSGLQIVPVSLSDHNKQNLRIFAQALAETIKKSSKKSLILASTDFSHYEPAKIAREKDDLCISAIEALDEEKLWEIVHSRDISMCGYIPVYVTIIAAKELGAQKGQLLLYGTSGDVTGDQSEVVGYGSLMIN